VREVDWQKYFEFWRLEMWKWIDLVGIDREKVHELEVAPEDRAHYSKRTIDFEFDYPFGCKELYGLAYRTDYDLKKHAAESGVDMTFFDEEKKERFVPHVIEPTFGHGRTMLVVLLSAYREEEMNGEIRTYLKLSPKIAPVKCAVFPLLKNKSELVAKAREVFQILRKEFACEFDDNGNIGKRYRRQDEIGTPFCVTVDFDTIEKNAGVTVRDRDTGEQTRMPISELANFVKSKI
jgi:glycyl-tRNA synthetase